MNIVDKILLDAGYIIESVTKGDYGNIRKNKINIVKGYEKERQKKILI